MDDIVIWLKIGEVFINQDNIRGISRMVDGTRISRIVGDDIEVKADYDRVRAMLALDTDAKPDHL